MARVLVSAIATPFGALYLASRNGCFLASHGPQSGPSDELGWAAWRWGDVAPAVTAHAAAHEQIDAYCSGELRTLALPLILEGNPLHVAAWRAALAIPYGESATYGTVAARIGLPGRARAVGRAMAVCPLPLLIPLQRVVAAGERRCGDLDDWQRRMQLLQFERETLARAAPARVGAATAGGGGGGR